MRDAIVTAVSKGLIRTKRDANARHDWMETAQEVALRNAFFEVERVEQPLLPTPRIARRSLNTRP